MFVSTSNFSFFQQTRLYSLTNQTYEYYKLIVEYFIKINIDRTNVSRLHGSSDNNSKTIRKIYNQIFMKQHYFRFLFRWNESKCN